MRTAWLLLSTLIAAPALAQSADPLAPIEPLIQTPPIESVTNFPEIAPAPAVPPAPPRVIPRDWRGVFAADRKSVV